MAELDPEKVGRLGVDPTTGSPLSQEVRNALLKKSTIDAATFRNEMSAAENRRKEVDIQNASVIQSQERALGGFNSNIQALRTDIGKLGTGLASIALLLQQDGAAEQNRIRTEQEQQRRLTERQIRIGKENELEKKIQNALAEPVQKLTPQVNEVFGNIGKALGILFGGWLTKQTVDAIKASEEGNTTLFNDIKWNIIKNLGIVGGGLLAIKLGFSLVTRTISGIASGLTRLLIAKPLAIAAALLPKGSKPRGGPPPGRRPGSGFNVRGNLAIGSLMTGLDIAGGEDPKRAVAGATAGMIGSAAAFGLGSLIPIPGSGIISGAAAYSPSANFGKDIYDKFFGKTQTDSRTLKEEKPKESPKPAVTSESVPSAPPAPAPDAPAPTLTKEQQDKYNQATSALQGPFAGVARGKVTDYYNKLSPDDQKTFKDYLITRPQSEQNLYSFLKETAPSNSTNSPAQMSAPPTAQPQRVGELPEAKPSLTMIKTSNNQNQQANVPLTNGPLTDVPLINSANPDNFYVLYSQLSYNVVM